MYLMIIIISAFKMVLLGKRQHPGAGAPVYKFLPSAKGLGAVGASWPVSTIGGGGGRVCAKRRRRSDNKATGWRAAPKPGSVRGRAVAFTVPDPFAHRIATPYSLPAPPPSICVSLSRSRKQIPRCVCLIQEGQCYKRLGVVAASAPNLSFPAARMLPSCREPRNLELLGVAGLAVLLKDLRGGEWTRCSFPAVWSRPGF